METTYISVPVDIFKILAFVIACIIALQIRNICKGG
jgi:hypothetical protein